MTDNLIKAHKLMLNNNYTCVLVSNENCLISNKRGVKPLLEFLDTKEKFENFSAADRVIGKGAAFLYLLLKIKEIYAQVISESALELLKSNGVTVYYGEVVGRIQNRQKNGFCPIETAVLNVCNENEALNVIKETLKKIK